jgi:pimeloyl-ACP methyl ester carboxylesterase
MLNIYVFTGLGADETVFKNIDFGENNVIHINYINPLVKETLSAYAQRLTSQITDNNPILIGISFGGMICIEIGKLIKTDKIILINSVTHPTQLSRKLLNVGRLLLPIIPISLLKKSNYFTYFIFGIKNIENKKILSEILRKTDPSFLKWALTAILNWKTTQKKEIENLIEIHGANDRLIPLKNRSVKYIIPHGGHLMTLDHYQELNKILKEELN